MINQQKRLKAARDEKDDRIKKKRQEIENTPNPHLKEIETCEHLIQYCHKLKVEKGLVQASSEEVAAKTEKEMILQYNKQDIEQKLKEGKIQAVERNEEENFKVNKGKKGKKAGKKSDNSTSLNIDFAVINKFGLVNVSPPITSEDLDHKIDELTQKKQKFIEEGSKILSKEKADLEKYIEQMVEEDIENELKAAAEADEYGEEEEEKKEAKP